MLRGAAAAVALLVVAIAAGCGGGDEAEEPSLRELAALLPEDTYVLQAVDLDALRSELGVASDADPAVFPEEGDEEGLAFSGAAAGGLGHVTLAISEYFDPDKDPLVRSIDHSQVSAAASGTAAKGGEMTVLVTSQPFDEIASALEDEGWSRDGEVVHSDDPRADYGFAADAGDGRVLLSTSEEPIEAALAGDGEGPADAALLDELDGSVRLVTAFPKRFGCVELVAGGQDAESGKGVVLFEPIVDAGVLLDELEGVEDVSLDEAQEDGELIELSFTDQGEPEKGLAVQRVETALISSSSGIETIGPGEDVDEFEVTPTDCARGSA